ncbi:coiled-coil domain-containing protein [Paenibacillus chartarius]|uniref:Coiled-coil domain-containing protein n=1 Tax=Paenibacillus chartarius TaxID=747481 RepID=A0ABV6DUI4_9BACL
MDKRRRNGLIGFFLLLIVFGTHTVSVYADNESRGSVNTVAPGTEALVQKGLTIAEIDRELARLKNEEATLTGQMSSNEQLIAAQDKLVEAKRQQAGRVLRSYYMGERDSLWLLLLSVDSFQNAIRTFEYLDMIITSDKRKLTAFRTARTELQNRQNELNATRSKLQQAQTDYLAQRDRLIRLQDELDAQLAGNEEAKAVMQRIQEVTVTWQQKGIPLFRTYFQALAETMKSLPELAAKAAPDGRIRLSFDGLNAIFTLSDSDLNDFLRSKNELFRDLTFRFVQDGLQAGGKRDDLELNMEGVYVWNEEKRLIEFQVKKLTFNGLDLPDTTIRDLEKQVDLSLNPRAFHALFIPTQIKQEEGKLTIRLKINF